MHKVIEERLQTAVTAVLPDAATAAVLVRPCPDPKFGDYQTNALMGLAKERKMNPRQLASAVSEQLSVADICEPVELAGAGFLNFRLKTSAIEQALVAAARGEHLFFEKADKPRTVVIDFSSPNVAKPMHVGHIRSTILGDSLARTLLLLGHQVITDNHIGDWGTQFGKLLVGWKRHLDQKALETDPIGEMERLYKMVNAAGEADPKVLEEARQELVKLQHGDAENLALWRQMIALSQVQFDSVYTRLGVRFNYTLGESFYNPRLEGLVQELLKKGLARESEGAIAVFFEDIPQLSKQPALIQKSDGAFNYTTTDLATLQHRLETWHPQEIIYVTGAPQQLHFQQLFAIFRRWYPNSGIKLAHVWFGSILGEDGKPFRTRTGETIKLADLLDEAEARAFAVVSEISRDLPEAQRRDIARVVGLGAIKYADLLPNRQSDYVFSWDKMLALNGNSAPYLQYAYARTRSVFRKAAESGVVPSGTSLEKLQLEAPEELALAKLLLNFGFALERSAEEYRPNFICNYLYELAGSFARFWENCPVLKSESAQRESRLTLCDLTGKVLQQGLAVLGIETLEQM
ncbi:MAG TPA: arginine--tRNA ligase [Candidatus Limnocylindrales bacterium]|nr:arginine--tRNA ligase [Candidatus Limnocylindrales bacterium]